MFLLYSDGKSRLFGFIGFSSAAEAAAAVKYFNKTFLDASRLEVEFAFQYGSQEQPRAWSKYTEGSSAHKRLVEATGANTVAIGKGKGTAAGGDDDDDAKGKKKKKKPKEPKPEEVDPKLKEFMALMQPRAKQAVWANDDLGAADGVTATVDITGGGKQGKIVLEDGNGSDDELYEDLPKAESSEEGEDSSDDDDEEGGKDAVVVDTGVSDLDYLKSRVRKNFDEDEDLQMDLQEEEEENSEEEESSEEESSEEESEDEEKSEKSGKEEDIEKKQTDGEDLDDIFSGKKKKDTTTNGIENGGAHGASRLHRGSDHPSTIIGETGRLFVRNLPYSATEDDLKAIFEPHGALEEVHIVLDKATRRSKGYALIQFSNPPDAIAAFDALDRSIFMGRLLHVLPGMKAPTGVAEEQTAVGGDAGGDSKTAAAAEGEDGLDGQVAPTLKGNTSSYKRQKEADLKASAGNTVAWNSLFMRSDTVAEAVAAHYGVTKSDLLDPTAPDMAVRMALGETQVIAETKSALAEAGVDVEALENAAAAAGGKKNQAKSTAVDRSDRILLVKNLPYSADEEELETLFAAIGPVLRLVLPPTRTLALVEYSEAQDARRAFKALAYKRYQSVPIYLEWAPKGILNGSSKATKKTNSSTKEPVAAASDKTKNKNKETPAAAAEEEEEEEEKAAAAAGGARGAVRAEDVAASLAAGAAGDESIESTTIYVKNLSFKTEEPALRKHFTEAVEAAGGSLRTAKVAKSKTKDGRLLSSGFGFIECSSESVAREVIKSLQGSSLDGHNLALQLSSKNEAGGGSTGGTAAKRKNKSSNSAAAAPPTKGAIKIVVRNLAFEASRQDILGLFTPFGAVKSCRLPRKFDGSLRGFAFVEFATPQEARAAVEAVSGTHLYGRRLVIEWAEDEGGLEELRAKTASGFRGGGGGELVQQQQQQWGGGGGGEEEEEELYEERENKKRRKK